MTTHDKRIILDEWLKKIFKGCSSEQSIRKSYRDMDKNLLENAFETLKNNDPTFRVFVAEY